MIGAYFVSGSRHIKKPAPLINVAHYSWVTIVFTVVMFAVAVGLVFLLPYSGVTDCRPEDERWIVAILIGVFGVGGVSGVLCILYYSIEWNSKSLAYRSLWGRRCTARFDDIVDMGHYWWLGADFIKFENEPTLYYSSSYGIMRNIEAFELDAIHHVNEQHPHYFYEAAFREDVVDSNQCGCLACLTIFPATAISKWRKATKDWDGPEDLAICPACGHGETVLCDMGKVKMTHSELRIVNMKMEADLSTEDSLKRQREREEAHEKLNPKKLPPGFKV